MTSFSMFLPAARGRNCRSAVSVGLTLRRAIDALAFFRPKVGGRDEETVATRRARALCGPSAVAVRHRDQELAGLNDGTERAVAAAPRVAGVAARDEVWEGVVGCIVVQVIHDKSAPGKARSGHPINLCAAPVTAVRARADAVVEDNTRDECDAARWGDRVHRRSHHSVLDTCLPLFASTVCLVAGARAVAVGVILGLRLEGRSACRARSIRRGFHVGNSTIRKRVL